MDTDLGNRSPMSIFNQAVCIKDVKDLTQFIREHMLDDGGSKEKLVALQERFDDLKALTEGLKLHPTNSNNWMKFVIHMIPSVKQMKKERMLRKYVMRSNHTMHRLNWTEE